MSAWPAACIVCGSAVRVLLLLRVGHHLQEWRRHLHVSGGPQGELPPSTGILLLTQAQPNLMCWQACLRSVSPLPWQLASKWGAAELWVRACTMQVTGQDHLIFDPLPADVQELSQGDGGISWIVKGRVHAHLVLGLELALLTLALCLHKVGCLCLPDPPLMRDDRQSVARVMTSVNMCRSPPWRPSHKLPASSYRPPEVRTNRRPQGCGGPQCRFSSSMSGLYCLFCSAAGGYAG